MSIFHPRQIGQPNPKNFICDICQITNSSLSSLNCHKKKDQGKKRKTLSENQPKSKKNKTKPRTINDMVRANKTMNQTIENRQEDDEYSARNCTINEIDGAEITVLPKMNQQMELDSCDVCGICIYCFIVDMMYLSWTLPRKLILRIHLRIQFIHKQEWELRYRYGPI